MMYSGGKRNSAAVDWAGLPPELLATISGFLEHRRDTVSFRSVCQSWRSSAAPPPNKLSPFLPLKAPFFDGRPYHLYSHVITATAIYLVRPRSDPSKAWLVSVQEDAAGKAVLRHPLLYRELNAVPGLGLDADRIAATQTPVARFYAHNLRCHLCDAVGFNRKTVLVPETSRLLVGVSNYPDMLHLAFRLDSGGGGFEATAELTGKDVEPHRKIQDLVSFKGRIFTVNEGGHVCVLDHANLQLVQLTEKPLREFTTGGSVRVRNRVQFVVSDGDLYVVWIAYGLRPLLQVYRLLLKEEEQVAANNNNNNGRIGIGMLLGSEKVEDLGDRVFFITDSLSFSISARALPHPWRQGNCVFIMDPMIQCSCKCARFIGSDLDYRHRVFDLRRRSYTRLCTAEGHSYLDLFHPPASFVIHDE